MTTSRATAPQWSVKADEILADGQWHDGMQLVREIEKTVTPGVALRRVESYRQSRLRARDKEGQDRKTAPPERRLIAMGQRAITQSFILSRVRRGSYVTDPSPIPEDGWRGQGGWMIRDARVQRTAYSVLAERYSISHTTARSLIFMDPPIPHRRTKRRIEIEDRDVPLFEARVEEYRRQALERRSARSLAAHERRRQARPDRLALSIVARQFGIAPSTGSALKKLTPGLGWIEAGRVTYLPLDRVPDFEVVVEAYKLTGRGHNRGDLVPAFKNEKLAELFQRYMAGERDLREEVFAQMRRAYDEAPDL